MGGSNPVMLTWMPRPHKTRPIEDHSDEPGTSRFTFDRAQRNRYKTDVDRKKSAVISMSSSMLEACQLKIMGNHRREVCSHRESFPGSPLLVRNPGSRAGTRSRAPQCRYSGDASCHWTSRKHSLLPFLHGAEPSISGDTIHSCTRAWHRCTALEEGQKQDLCPEKPLGPRTVPVPEVCLFCLLLQARSQLPRRQEDRTITDIYLPLTHHKIYEVKPHRIEGRNRQFYNNSWRFQHPTQNNGQNNQTEDK